MLGRGPAAITGELKEEQPRLLPWASRWEGVPWWALILALTGLAIVWFISTNASYGDTFRFLVQGLRITLLATLSAFVVSLVLGLGAGLARVSRHPVPYTLSTLYVEVVRGVPILVQLIYVAFVLVPITVEGLNGLGRLILANAAVGPLAAVGFSLRALHIRDVDMIIRAIIGLAFAYGAFEAEVFRAGIQSIPRGQMEAARSVGMSHFQAMRYIILPQAIRVVLPPLGNDFIAMLKDSSLLSALAVRELTQLGKLNRARTFSTYETWNLVGFLYLTMTLALSIMVKLLERRMRTE